MCPAARKRHIVRPALLQALSVTFGDSSPRGRAKSVEPAALGGGGLEGERKSVRFLSAQEDHAGGHSAAEQGQGQPTGREAVAGGGLVILLAFVWLVRLIGLAGLRLVRSGGLAVLVILSGNGEVAADVGEGSIPAGEGVALVLGSLGAAASLP